MDGLTLEARLKKTKQQYGQEYGQGRLLFSFVLWNRKLLPVAAYDSRCNPEVLKVYIMCYEVRSHGFTELSKQIPWIS